MNIEEMQSVWQEYDKKLQSAQALSEKLIESMIKERSLSRVSTVQRQSRFFFVVLTIELLALVAILSSNPFDFKYTWQFIPFVLLFIGVLIAFVNLWQITGKINQTASHHNIGEFIKNILAIYEKNKVFEKWFGVLFLSLGFMIPLSFLPPKIERMGWSGALIDIAIMTAVTLVLYLFAFKFGAFKNHHEVHFKKDYEELRELKSILAED